MKLVFAGTPDAALPSLTALLGSRHEVVAVVTRPDARSGRGRSLLAVAGRRARRPSTAWRCSSRRGRATPISSTGWRSSRPTAARWSRMEALLPQPALDIPARGWVNLHFSVLPAWRGAAPVQRASDGRRRGDRGDHVPARRGARRRADVRPVHRDASATTTPQAPCSAGSPSTAPELLVTHPRRHRGRRLEERAQPPKGCRLRPS